VSYVEHDHRLDHLRTIEEHWDTGMLVMSCYACAGCGLRVFQHDASEDPPLFTAALNDPHAAAAFVTWFDDLLARAGDL